MNGLLANFESAAGLSIDVALMPVLGAGIGSAISVLFLVIAFISWLWNVINGNQNAPPGQGQAPGRAKLPPPGERKVEKELQAEINRFLKNVMGKEGNEEELVAIEEVEEEPRSRSRQRRRQGGKTIRHQDVVPLVEEDSSHQGPRPGGRISSRKGPGSTNLGSGVRTHVQEHMQEGRVTRLAKEHMAHGVAEHVTQSLGQFTTASLGSSDQQTSNAAVITRDARTATSTGVIELLRNPSTMKQAFVMSLILTRPTFGRDRRR